MKSVKTEKFKKAFDKLPIAIQGKAWLTYNIWKSNHYHPKLHFKRIHSGKPIYSVRIGLSYRALGVIQEDAIIWFWIGSHEDYNNLISQL